MVLQRYNQIKESSESKTKARGHECGVLEIFL